MRGVRMFSVMLMFLAVFQVLKLFRKAQEIGPVQLLYCSLNSDHGIPLDRLRKTKTKTTIADFPI